MDLEESFGALVIAHLALAKSMLQMVEAALDDDEGGEDENPDPTSDLPDGMSMKIYASRPRHEPEVDSPRRTVDFEDLPPSVQEVLKRVIKTLKRDDQEAA